MKKIKILIPIIIVLIGIVICDEANITVEDVINQKSAIDNTSPVESMIGKAESGDVSIYLYYTEDSRIGYATIKENDSFTAKYSLCSVENIDTELLKQNESIVRNYDKQKLDFIYGITVNPENDIFIYENQEYKLSIFDCGDFKIGIFIKNNL